MKKSVLVLLLLLFAVISQPVFAVDIKNRMLRFDNVTVPHQGCSVVHIKDIFDTETKTTRDYYSYICMWEFDWDNLSQQKGYQPHGFYDYAFPFSNDVAKVKKDGKWGFVDLYHDMIIPAEFEDVDTNYSGPNYGNFEFGLEAVKSKGKWGYINKRGDWVIWPQYDEAFAFAGNIAKVKKGGKTFIIDKKNKTILSEYNFKYIDQIIEYSPYFILITRQTEKSCYNECNIATTDGKLLSEWMSNYFPGMSLPRNNVYFQRNGYSGNKAELMNNYSGNSMSKGNVVVFQKNEFFGFIKYEDGKYEVMVRPIFEDYQPEFVNGTNAVRLGDNWGYIDMDGEFIIKPKFQYAQSYSESENDEAKTYAVITGNGYYGAIDDYGKLLFKKKNIEMLMGYSDGLFAFYDNKHEIGFLDTKGKVVIKPKFSNYDVDSDFLMEHKFKNGLCILGDGNHKVGVIDKKGEWVILPEYDYIVSEDNVFFVLTKGDYQYLYKHL